MLYIVIDDILGDINLIDNNLFDCVELILDSDGNK